jgi:hypothetical protein
MYAVKWTDFENMGCGRRQLPKTAYMKYPKGQILWR